MTPQVVVISAFCPSSYVTLGEKKKKVEFIKVNQPLLSATMRTKNSNEWRKARGIYWKLKASSLKPLTSHFSGKRKWRVRSFNKWQRTRAKRPRNTRFRAYLPSNASQLCRRLIRVRLYFPPLYLHNLNHIEEAKLFPFPEHEAGTQTEMRVTLMSQI